MTPLSATARALPVTRTLLAALLLLVAVGSIAVSLPSTTHALLRQWHHDRRIPRAVRAGWVPAMPFDPGLMAWYASRLEPGDSFYVQASTRGGPSSPRTALVLAGGFALLPHLMVDRPGEASVILSYDADPKALGLRYTTIQRLAPGISVARVDHAR